MPPARTSSPIGDYKLYGKYRNCTKLSGCEGWQIQPVIGLDYNGRSFTLGGVSATLYASPSSSGGFFLSILQNSPSTTMMNGPIPGGTGSIRAGDANYRYSFNGVPFVSWAGGTMNMTGSFNKNCLWYTMSGSTAVDANGYYRDAVVVLYGTH